MGNSSILGIDKAPTRAPGVDSDALGPSDSSDSGSDLIGADPPEVAGEPLPEREAADISVDRVLGADGQEPGEGEAGVDVDEDEDPALGFMDEAEAADPSAADDEDDGDAGDPTDGPLAGARPDDARR